MGYPAIWVLTPEIIEAEFTEIEEASAVLALPSPEPTEPE
jgi:hypothetical protein